MNSYIINFATYTFAMIGFIALILYVYKKSVYNTLNVKNKNYLNVENILRLSPAKTIYIIKAGTERFLIAGDNSTTTMLAKLDKDNLPEDTITSGENEKVNNS